MTRSKPHALKRRLSNLLVRRLTPKAAAFLVWDTRQRGLAVRVRPTGHKAWKVIYSRGGRPRWLHLGTTDAIPLAEARTMAAETLLAVAKGRDPAAEKKANRSTGTFAELHTRYVEQHAKKNNKSWKQADALIRRNALPRWGKLQASSITRSGVKALMARIEAPIVANQTLAAVSAVFTWGVTEQIVGGNPCRGVPRNATRSRERMLAVSEMPQLWKALDHVEPVSAAALRTILITGQRPGEVAHMRREHIKDWWWEKPGEPIADIWPGTKNKKAHRVWLSAQAQAIIATMLDGNDPATGYVFKIGSSVRSAALAGMMRRAVSLAAIERATPHDLRRTFCSMVTGIGFGRPAVDRILNHANRTISSVNDRHSYAAEDKHIMETVAARIMALVEGRSEVARSST